MIIALIFLTIGLMLFTIYTLVRVRTTLREIQHEQVAEIPESSQEHIPETKGRNPAIVFGVVIIAVCGFFTFFAHTIPQVEFHPPEKVEIAADLSGEDLAKLGKEIFEGKGTCLLCHTINGDGLRAPDLSNVGERAGSRKEGYFSEDYLFESLLFPPKYVVQGYVPSMPPMDKPPAQLSPREMAAVIAFLQSMGGEITVIGETLPDYEKIGKPE